MSRETETLSAVDAELRRLWDGLRDNASQVHVAQVDAQIRFAQRVGLLSEERAELWFLRVRTCPGHADEGGRAWCAYGCDLSD